MKVLLFIGKQALSVLILFISVSTVLSQTDETCMECHGEPDIEMKRNGKKVSLHVKKFELARSAHSKVKCSQCHAGYDPYEIPHKEKIEPINCINCHKDYLNKHKFHPTMKSARNDAAGAQLANCKNCHGTHNVMSSKSPSSPTHFLNSTEYCGKCHVPEMQQHLKSEHFVKLTKDNPNSPTCIFCHNYAVTKGWGLQVIDLKLNQEKLCLSCHLNNPDIQTQYSKSLVNYEQSVHGQALLKGNKNAAVCIDCHGSHDLEKADSPNSKINRFRIPDVCGKCHISVTREYESSIHGIALAKGNPDVPGCTYCHGEHDIAPIPEIETQAFTDSHINKTTFLRNKMVYCAVCHMDEKMMSKYNLSTVQKAHNWLPSPSAHWETVRCVDCHSSYIPPNLSHNILPPDKTVKKCEECHSKNSILMTKLYKHEKESSREKFGFINGTILSDAYVIGTTRNVILDTLSIIIASVTVVLIGFHALLRWYFNRAGKIK